MSRCWVAFFALTVLILGTVAPAWAGPRTDLYGDPLPSGAVARLGTLRFRHSWLRAITLSPDGRTVAGTSSSIADHRPIRLWDVATGQEVRRMADGSGDSTLAWSLDGKLLASAYYDDNHPIRLWDVATGKAAGKLDGHEGGVESLAWSPDGKLLASGGDAKTVSLWDVAARKELRRLAGHTDYVEQVAWAPDGKVLASAGQDDTVRLWDVERGTQLRRLVGYRSMSWSPDGKVLALGSKNKTISLWDLTTGQEFRRLTGSFPVVWSPDSKTLALGSYDAAICIIDPATGKELKRIDGLGSSLVAWSPDGKTLVSELGWSIHLWDATTGKEIRPGAGHTSNVRTVAWSPDGKLLASGSCDNTIRLWDSATGKEVRVLDLKGRQCDVEVVAWSPDGKLLASGSEPQPSSGAAPPVTRRMLRLWDPATGKEVRALDGHTGAVRSLAWSPDGKTLASGSDDKTIRAWDVTTGKELYRIATFTDEVHALAWSPDGNTLAAAGQDHTQRPESETNLIRQFDAGTGKEVRRLVHEGSVGSLAWSPDGTTLAATSDGTICLWEATTGRQVRRFAAAVRSLAWAPDGRAVAGGSYDKMVHVWETASGKAIDSFAGHEDSIQSVAWSPDGNRLVSAGWETSLLIWAFRQHPDEPPLRLGRSALQSYWLDLASDDTAQAHHAVRTLTRAARDSVPFLAECLKPVPPPDPKRVARLIDDLDDARYSVRQKAAAELEQMRELAEPALRRAVAAKPSLEVRRRLEHLLNQLNIWSGEQLRAQRAVTVLECIGTAEARQLLAALATGTSAASLTKEAQASLDHLNKR